MTRDDFKDLPEALSGYFERTGVALSLSRVGEDVPLVLVNDAFCALTGYGRDEVIGQNCRFLQGEETTEASRADIRRYVEGTTSSRGGRFVIQNYRKDGTRFRNLLFLNRLRGDGDGQGFIIGSQFDMTSTMRDQTLVDNDRELGSALSRISSVGEDFGLVMMGAAKTLADSHAMLAELSLRSTLGVGGSPEK